MPRGVEPVRKPANHSAIASLCLAGAFCTGFACLLSCRDKPAATPPLARPNKDGEPPPRTSLLPPESDVWTAATAAEMLSDPSLRLPAALRLIELAEVDALCCAEPLTDDRIRRLATLPLDEESFVIGFGVAGSPNVLRAPVRVAISGDVTPFAAGAEEEIAALYLAADADLFPHVVLLPYRVILLTPAPEPAIELKTRGAARFTRETVDGLPLIMLKTADAGGWREVARYT
jgi:hypothetical protein